VRYARGGDAEHRALDDGGPGVAGACAGTGAVLARPGGGERDLGEGTAAALAEHALGASLVPGEEPLAREQPDGEHALVGLRGDGQGGCGGEDRQLVVP